MNASAIYSKSGKGVQEAAGKTSHLSRPDRAVLSAIDGRATLGEVALKVGRTFDAAFEKLIQDLDKGGFIRAVSAGSRGAAPKPAAGAKPAAASGKPATAPMDAASDLDFTAALTIPKGKATPPRATPPPAKQTATIPPPPPPPSSAEKAQAAKSAKEQQDAFAKAREDAEKKAHAERDRVKSEAEAKVRAETEAKMRAEAKAEADKKFAAELEAKARGEADAKVKAAAGAKAKADAEARKAREEEARREQEERRAREEAERRAKEEAKRLEEERRQLEEERKAREEEKRREEEERAARRKREEEEEARERAERAERKKREEEEEARERAERAERKKREEEEEEARERAEREARRKSKTKEDEPEAEKPQEKPKAKAKEPEPAKAAGGGFSDSLLADLDSFTTRDDEEQKAKEEAERKEKEEAARRAREAEERRAKEEAERQEREAKEQRKREEAGRKAREEAELRESEEKEKERLKEEEEKRKKEAEEREKKAKQEETLAARSVGASTFDAAERARREGALLARSRPKAAAARVEKKGWGKPITITLFLLLVIAVGVAHVMPVDVADYQTAATDALRRPVTIRSANLSLLTGLQVRLHDVTIGETKIGEVRAFPEIDALLGPKKHFSRIEIAGAKLDQQVVGEALFAKVRADNFSVGRIVVKQLELTGPLSLPKGLELEVNYDAEGAVRSAVLRGPQALLVRVLPKGPSVEFDTTAASFTLPFAPEISLSTFSMKGTVTPQGLSVQEWDGQVLNGTLSGTANVTWGESWKVEGVLTARNIYAAVFAPALLSDGKAEGSGKFSMRGDPGKLASSGRIDGTFTVNRGVLGSIDLAKAIQSGGKQAQGRTQFNEMSGQAVYDRGAISLRNVTIGAGQLNAGASVDISPSGALSGRIVADVKVASQTQRAILHLGGNLQEPQVKN